MAFEDVLYPLLCDVWRDVGRHLHIEESAGFVLPHVAAVLPVSFLAIRRWDADRALLSTAAVAGAAAEPLVNARSSVPTPLQRALAAWGVAGVPNAWLSRDETSLARLLVPEGVAGPVAAAPLREDGTLLGAAIWGGDLRGALPLLRALQEPLAVALANDARLHQLQRLREAADADRQALLTRLGRHDVSEQVVGSDEGMREVMARVRQVAPTDAPVLLLGETGSGKEVVARAIHRASPRADGPFLRVNCGAIPAELVDSELFGHEKGSFTGAVATRRGWFERADGGTLLLDEVGDLPPAAQVRLLRVLQDGTFQRVGGQQEHHVDVRIVAATHHDMPRLVRDGAFRRDLWYRLSVFPIHLPPLRDRPADIPALARFFAERAGLRLRGEALAPTDADLARLVAYDWPGNVRELGAVIERAAILGDGHHLAVDLALGVSPGLGPPAPTRGPDAGPPGDERAEVEALLERCHGRIEGPFGAAAALGLNPATFRSRLRKLGIDWARYRRRG